MKDQSFTVIEYHPDNAAPPDKAIGQTVTAWLIKELHSRSMMSSYASEEV